jgi:hypothetical protein
MESCLQTEKVQIDSEVLGVGSMMQFQQAVLEELRSSIHILQEQDNQIGGEATDLIAGIRSDLEAQSKIITEDGLQVFAQKVSIEAVQKLVGVLSKRIDEVNKVLATMTESMKCHRSRSLTVGLKRRTLYNADFTMVCIKSIYDMMFTNDKQYYVDEPQTI